MAPRKRSESSDSESSRRSSGSRDRELQEYFASRPQKMPSGCRACGGPYPSCRDSCSLFDDD